MDNRGIESDPGWVNRALQGLQRQIDALRSERRASATTVGTGNWVIDGGDVVMLDEDGSVLFRLGEQPYGDRGVSIYRADGSLALSTRKRLPGATTQSLELRDDNGNVILSEAEFGTGLDYPWLPLHVQPFAAASSPVQAGPHGLEGPLVTSSTFTTTHLDEVPRMNQQSRWRFAVAASDITTAAEVRVIRESTGTALAPAFASPWLGVRAAGSTTYVDVDPGAPLVLPGNFGETVRLLVQVRRTAGAGSLTCAVPFAHGYKPAY